MSQSTDQKRSKRYTRQAVTAQMHDALNTDGAVEYQVNEGDDQPVFRLPHPFFYDKATKDALKALAQDDEEGRAKVLLGDQWDAFVEAGGDASDIDMLAGAIQLDAKSSLANAGPTKQ